MSTQTINTDSDERYVTLKCETPEDLSLVHVVIDDER